MRPIYPRPDQFTSDEAYEQAVSDYLDQDFDYIEAYEYRHNIKSL